VVIVLCKKAGIEPAFFMSRMLQKIPFCSQWFSLAPRGYTQHERDMTAAIPVAILRCHL
jgi:hypothetical protein